MMVSKDDSGQNEELYKTGIIKNKDNLYYGPKFITVYQRTPEPWKGPVAPHRSAAAGML